MRQVNEDTQSLSPLGRPKRLEQTATDQDQSKCSKPVDGKPHLRQNEKGQLETYQHVAGKR